MSYRRSPRLPSLLCLATLLLCSSPAAATSVAILWPSSPSAETAQVLTLLRGELLSLGFETTRADQTARESQGTNSVLWLEGLAARGASAVIRTVGEDALEAIDVWIVKTHPQRFEVTHVAVDPNAARPSETLVLRAVEALRAGLLQIDWAARRRGSEPSAEPSSGIASVAPSPAPAPYHERFAPELGAAVVFAPDGLGPAVLPTLSVGWAARPWLTVQVLGAGLGSRSAVQTAAGRAEVSQQYALLGARYRVRSSRRLWPFLGLGAGVLRTTVEGQSGAATQGQHLEQWSGVIDVCAGAGLRVHGRTYLALAAHVQLADPYVAVHVVDTVGATSGRPNLLLTLALGAWL